MDSTLNQSNTLGLQVVVRKAEVNNTFIKYAQANGYIILGEFSFPETLDESANALITDVREQDLIDPAIIRSANPDRLALAYDSVYPDTISIPDLISMQEYRCHWGLFSDYNPNSLYSVNELKNRLRKMTPAGITCVINFDGVPLISVKSIDIVSKTITINWHPVPYLDKSTRVSGLLYKGTELESIDTLVTNVVDLARTNEYTIPFGLDDQLYIKFQTRVTINSVEYLGPISNILLFSFKR